MVIKLSGFAEIFIFSTPASMVSGLDVIAHYATSSLIWRNVRSCMTSFSAKNLLLLKLNIIKRIFFLINMAFISFREVRKCIFHSWLRAFTFSASLNEIDTFNTLKK